MAKAAKQNSDAEFIDNTNLDTVDAVENQIGEKVDANATPTLYLRPDGKKMIVEMEDEVGQVFAHEPGHNSTWYPKEVVSMWKKL